MPHFQQPTAHTWLESPTVFLLAFPYVTFLHQLKTVWSSTQFSFAPSELPCKSPNLLHHTCLPKVESRAKIALCCLQAHVPAQSRAGTKHQWITESISLCTHLMPVRKPLAPPRSSASSSLNAAAYLICTHTCNISLLILAPMMLRA